MVDGAPNYVSMKVMRMEHDSNYIIAGVSNIDAQMKQKALIDRIRTNEVTYARVMALTGNYICLYTVDPATGHYVEYNSSSEFEGFGLSKTGEDFFTDAVRNGEMHVCAEDYPVYRQQMSLANMLGEIKAHGHFTLKYRLMIDGTLQKVRLRAGTVRENDGEKLIVGVIRRD